METRKQSIPIRLTDQEYKDIKDQASKNGQSASEYMRSRIFSSGDFQAMQLTRELERLREGMNKNFTVIDKKLVKLKDDNSLRLSVLQECVGKALRMIYYLLNISSRFILSIRSKNYSDDELVNLSEGLKKLSAEPEDRYSKDLAEYTEKYI